MSLAQTIWDFPKKVTAAKSGDTGPSYKESNWYHYAAYLKIDPLCPQGKAKIFDPDILYFQFIGEEASFTDSASADWQDVSVIGRSEDYKVYASTKNRTINFTLRFMATGYDDHPIYFEVKKKVDWLRALAYPYYDKDRDDRMMPPPRVLLSFGQLFPLLMGIIPEPSVTWNEPFDVDNLLPYMATVDVSFIVTNTIPKSSKDVLTGNDGQGSLINRPGGWS